jgi:hypothetical protein
MKIQLVTARVNAFIRSGGRREPQPPIPTFVDRGHLLLPTQQCHFDRIDPESAAQKSRRLQRRAEHIADGHKRTLHRCIPMSAKGPGRVRTFP